MKGEEEEEEKKMKKKKMMMKKKMKKKMKMMMKKKMKMMKIKMKKKKKKKKNLQGLKSPANVGNLPCWLRNHSKFRVHFNCPNILARSTSSAQIQLLHDIRTQRRFYCASSRVHKNFHCKYFSFERLELCLYNKSATSY